MSNIENPSKKSMNTNESIIKLIRKLLTLANNKGASRGEAENAMAMAQRLMTKYNITIANVGDEEKWEVHHEFYHQMKSALNPADKEISSILQQFYKVRILYSGNNGMIIIGNSEDIEIAKYVHGYLRRIFFKCWNEFKKTTRYANKADFYFGLRVGIVEKMEEAERLAKAEESQESCQKYELAIANNKEAIDLYVSNTFKNLRDSRRKSVSRIDANSFYSGREKGTTVQINQAIKE